MNRKPLRIAVLTSTRADYGIYQPLLRRLQADSGFELSIIAFGTHLSARHGHTIDEIEADGYRISRRMETVPADDSPQGIADAMGLTLQRFSGVWWNEQSQVDLVFCLGDRYEMFAAVAATIPFNIPIAHLHGGETTLGAMDDKFRHCLSHFASIHFTATQEYADRVEKLIGTRKNIYPVGALSLDNLTDMELYSVEEMEPRFGIDFSKPTALVTYHPETVAMNTQHDVQELIKAMDGLEEQIVITMPNADTQGMIVREALNAFINRKANVIGIESFGIKGYFSAMHHAAYLLGNTSSGIIEAASLKKYVVNVGDRQKGRTVSANVMQVSADHIEISEACAMARRLGDYTGHNVYHRAEVAAQIISVLNTIYTC